MKRALLMIAVVLGMGVLGSSASADVLFANGFETDTTGWFSPTRVASGTDGIISSDGSFHAKAGTDFTRWGGYNFGAGGGTHLRDFIFNAGFYNDTDITGSGNRFVISASNNSQRANAFAKNPGKDPIAISTTGWYTFEHHFYNNSGVLAVDMSITDDAADALVKKWTLSDPADLIALVGGNRYGWFDLNEFGTLAIDESSLERINVPTPFQEYKTSIDIYLNVQGGWANDTRFDFSSAVNQAVVPLPAAAWAGLCLIGGVGGLKGIRRIRRARD